MQKKTRTHTHTNTTIRFGLVHLNFNTIARLTSSFLIQIFLFPSAKYFHISTVLYNIIQENLSLVNTYMNVSVCMCEYADACTFLYSLFYDTLFIPHKFINLNFLHRFEVIAEIIHAETFLITQRALENKPIDWGEPVFHFSVLTTDGKWDSTIQMRRCLWAVPSHLLSIFLSLFTG